MDTWLYKHFRLIVGDVKSMLERLSNDGPDRKTFKQRLSAFSNETLTNIYDALRTDDLPNLYDERHEIIESIVDKLRIAHHRHIYPLTLGLLPPNCTLVSSSDLIDWAKSYGCITDERVIAIAHITHSQNEVFRELLQANLKLGSLVVFIESLIDSSFD